MSKLSAEPDKKNNNSAYIIIIFNIAYNYHYFHRTDFYMQAYLGLHYNIYASL